MNYATDNLMPDPILTATAPPTITPESTNGAPKNDKPFADEQLERFQAAFAEARPDQFKKPAGRETKSVDTETEPVHETKPSERETKPATSGTPRAAQWKEVNEERARLREENEKFKAEQEKWKTWETERKEYDTIKRHNAELLERIQTVAVEKDPRFENYFKTKTETAIALAKQAVGDTHADRVAKLLQLPDSDFRTAQLEEVMSEITSTRQARLGAAIVEMDRIHLERNTAISKSRENFEAMQKADRDKVQSQRQELERNFQDTLQKWSDKDKGLALFQKKDGDEAHNSEVDKRVATARDILNLNLSADQLSKAALWSAAAPGLLKDLLASREREKTLMTELQALKAGGPEFKSGTSGQQDNSDDKQYEGMSYGERVAAMASKAGGWQR